MSEETQHLSTDEPRSNGPEPLLRVEGLEKHYPITEGFLKREVGRVQAVDGISFEVRRGETVGIIGESGCGKSTAAEAVLRLEEPTGGEITFDGHDIRSYDEDQLRALRQRAGMIFQDPTGSFDPRLTVGESIAEFLVVHGVDDAETRRTVIVDLLGRVGLSAETVDRYPHELSGGQKQRAALARALVVNPDLLVADEPVSALDVSVQAEILALLDDLQDELGLGVLLISHDMSVVREICDRVNVMYLGKIVESGPTEEVLADPEHPYTEALVASVPTPDPNVEMSDATLSDEVPDPASPPSGCSFHTRCPSVIVPDGLDIDTETWHSIREVRMVLSENGSEELRERVIAERIDESVDTLDVQVLRDAFDIPPSLDDTVAETALTAGLNATLENDREAARDHLATFASVCEREQPKLDGSDRRSFACHLDRHK